MTIWVDTEALIAIAIVVGLIVLIKDFRYFNFGNLIKAMFPPQPSEKSSEDAKS